jgi:hypothetical protein
MGIPPIPAFPPLPYPLPPGFQIDPSHVLVPPEEDQCCASCVLCWLDCLILQQVPRAGFDWVITVNYKTFYLKWRDIAPRPPWTRQVWDIFQIMPGECGCPSSPRWLGWQWCWADVIKTLKHEIFSRWVNTFEGAGGVVLADGTNAFQPGTPGLAQIGPSIRLDAADDTTITEVGGFISEWRDKSTHDNHATQPVGANQPELIPGALNGLPVVRFDPTSPTWMDVLLRATADSHLFIVGNFRTNVAWPRGTFFSACGFDGTFGGIEGKVYQDGSIQTEGTPFVYVDPSDQPMIATNLTSTTYGIWEFSEIISGTGDAIIGVNAFDSTVFTGNTSDDFWDPTRQTFGEAIPLPAALGRSNWGVNGAKSFDYLDGDIGELLLYPRRLAAGERVQVLNALRAKWGLGAPLPFPPNP